MYSLSILPDELDTIHTIWHLLNGTKHIPNEGFSGVRYLAMITVPFKLLDTVVQYNQTQFSDSINRTQKTGRDKIISRHVTLDQLFERSEARTPMESPLLMVSVSESATLDEDKNPVHHLIAMRLDLSRLPEYLITVNPNNMTNRINKVLRLVNRCKELISLQVIYSADKFSYSLDRSIESTDTLQINIPILGKKLQRVAVTSKDVVDNLPMVTAHLRFTGIFPQLHHLVLDPFPPVSNANKNTSLRLMNSLKYVYISFRGIDVNLDQTTLTNFVRVLANQGSCQFLEIEAYQGRLPSELGQITTLVGLKVRGIDIELSNDLFDIKNLLYLHIEGCINKTVPHGLQELSNLQVLLLRNGRLREFPVLSKLRNLRILSVRDNLLQSMPVDLIKNLALHKSSIELSGNLLTSIPMAYLEVFEEIDIRNNKLTPSFLASISTKYGAVGALKNRDLTSSAFHLSRILIHPSDNEASFWDLNLPDMFRYYQLQSN